MEILYVAALAALLAAAGGALVQWVLCRREERRFPPPGFFVDGGGVSLHFQVKGQGVPVVVLDSPLAGTSLSWTEVQEKVAALTTVVSYDRGGFGWSGPSAEPRRVDILVAELQRALAAASLDPPYVLVGHSYGGFVANVYASRHPEEIAGLVLVDVPHPRKWARPSGSERKRIVRGARLARLAGLLAHFGLTRLLFRFSGPGRIESLPSLLRKLPRSTRAVIRSFWVRPATLRALASLIEEAPRSAVLVENAATSLGARPLDVLTASSPSPDRLRDQEQEAGRSQLGRHVVASKSGHWIPLEEPELVVDAIRRVVEEVRRLSPAGVSKGKEEARAAETTRRGP